MLSLAAYDGIRPHFRRKPYALASRAWLPPSSWQRKMRFLSTCPRSWMRQKKSFARCGVRGAESAERGWGGEDDERCDPALIFFTLQGISEWHSEGKLPHWAGAWTDRNGDFTWFTAPVQEKWPVPSGKHTKKYGNSPFLIGKPSISTDHFPWLCSS
jgi:hypothetical protein